MTGMQKRVLLAGAIAFAISANAGSALAVDTDQCVVGVIMTQSRVRPNASDADIANTALTICRPVIKADAKARGHGELSEQQLDEVIAVLQPHLTEGIGAIRKEAK
jgi:hypothetical protein